MIDVLILSPYIEMGKVVSKKKGYILVTNTPRASRRDAAEVRGACAVQVLWLSTMAPLR